MLSPSTTRTWPRRWISSLLALGFAASASRFAHAAISSVPDCRATGGGWSCYLPGILKFLVVIAIILGLLLTAVIAVAVRSYFKIKQDGKV